MDLPYRGLLTLLVAIGPLLPLSAQDRQPELAMPHVSPPAEGGSTLTGKERLGRKWTDEQRIDNCNVPIDKRGTKPRPSTCMPGGSASDVLLRSNRAGISKPPHY
jgi:ribosomal protein L27